MGVASDDEHQQADDEHTLHELAPGSFTRRTRGRHGRAFHREREVADQPVRTRRIRGRLLNSTVVMRSQSLMTPIRSTPIAIVVFQHPAIIGAALLLCSPRRQSLRSRLRRRSRRPRWPANRPSSRPPPARSSSTCGRTSRPITSATSSSWRRRASTTARPSIASCASASSRAAILCRRIRRRSSSTARAGWASSRPKSAARSTRAARYRPCSSPASPIAAERSSLSA